MIAGDDNLMGVGEGAKEIVELDDVIQHAVAGQVAGVDQDITIGDIKGSVQSVSVTDSDEFH